MRYWLTTIILSAIITSSVFADLLPPDAEGCTRKSAGDACATKEGGHHDGICVTAQNCRFVPEPDGKGSSSCSDILRCIKKEKHAGASTTAKLSDETEETQGCTTKNDALSFSSFSIGVAIFFALRLARARRNALNQTYTYKP